MQARWPWMLHGVDDEGGGPISATSSKASGRHDLPDTAGCLSRRPRRWKWARARQRHPTPAVLHKLEVAGCHEERSPPLRGLIRWGRTPPHSLGASACEELLPTTPTYKEGTWKEWSGVRRDGVSSA